MLEQLSGETLLCAPVSQGLGFCGAGGCAKAAVATVRSEIAANAAGRKRRAFIVAEPFEATPLPPSRQHSKDRQCRPRQGLFQHPNSYAPTFARPQQEDHR